MKETIRSLPVTSLLPNSDVIIDIPVGSVLKSILIDLFGLVTLTTAGTALRDEQPFGLIRRVQLLDDGTPTWVLPNTMLRTLNVVEGKTAPIVLPLAGVGIQTNTPFRAFTRIDFDPLDTVSKDLMFLNTRDLSTLKLLLSIGDLTDLVVGGAGSLSALIVRTHVIEVSDALPSGNIRRLFTLQRQMTATTSDFDIIMPVNKVYRRVYVKAQAGDTRNDAMISQLSLISGNEHLYNNLRFSSLQALNKGSFGVEGVLTGEGVLDFDTNLDYSYLLDSVGVGELFARFDTILQPGVNFITLLVEEITSLR